ncbi:hypothetical protein BKA62DRAFT_695864 [Auriculariales sp. MPI-PUGE-AT-0066]|nr:hypothetical protein BKA62DRAFT_695864 [Auriculariales sp. MPI-PUGE-AT-0066]
MFKRFTARIISDKTQCLDWSDFDAFDAASSCEDSFHHHADSEYGGPSRAQTVAIMPLLPEDVVHLIFKSYIDICRTQGVSRTDINDPSYLTSAATASQKWDSLILAQSAFAPPRVRINYARLRAPFILAAVCKQWRVQSLASPWLWTYIGVAVPNLKPFARPNNPSPKAVAKLGAVVKRWLAMIDLLLKRSREATLEVVVPGLRVSYLSDFGSGAEGWYHQLLSGGLTKLIPHMDRWRVWHVTVTGNLHPLWFVLRRKPTQHQNGDAPVIIRLPALEDLVFNHYPFAEPVFREESSVLKAVFAAPHLKRVRIGPGCGMEILNASLHVDSWAGGTQPRIEHLELHSQTHTMRPYVLPLLHASAASVRVLNLTLDPPGHPRLFLATRDSQDGDGPQRAGEAPAITTMPNLNEFSLSVHDLPATYIQSLVSMIAANSPRLRTTRVALRIRPTKSGVTRRDQLEAFLEAIARAPGIRCIELNGLVMTPTSGINPDASIRLAALLAQTRIQELHLVRCAVAPAFIAHLRRALDDRVIDTMAASRSGLQLQLRHIKLHVPANQDSEATRNYDPGSVNYISALVHSPHTGEAKKVLIREVTYAQLLV